MIEKVRITRKGWQRRLVKCELLDHLGLVVAELPLTGYLFDQDYNGVGRASLHVLPHRVEVVDLEVDA